MAREMQVTFDCADPGAQALFWAEALGYVLQPPPPGFDSWDAALDAWGVPPEARNDRSALLDPDGAGPRLFGPHPACRATSGGPRWRRSASGWWPWVPPVRSGSSPVG